MKADADGSGWALGSNHHGTGNLTHEEDLGLSVPVPGALLLKRSTQIDDDFGTSIRHYRLRMGIPSVVFEHPVTFDEATGGGPRFDLLVFHYYAKDYAKVCVDRELNAPPRKAATFWSAAAWRRFGLC